MAPEDGDTPVSRVARAVNTTKWAAKAKEVAASLKAQHAAGREGDESPAVPVWPTPKEQFEAFKHLFRSTPKDSVPADPVPADAVPADPLVADPLVAGTGSEDGSALDTDAQQVAEALRGVNWAEVRAATSERATDITKTMRSLADHVDWAKVQPVAAQVSSALIAAVAAGRIPVGGRLGPIVVRAITDQNDLGKRVATNFERTSSTMPPDFRGVIETTATDG